MQYRSDYTTRLVGVVKVGRKNFCGKCFSLLLATGSEATRLAVELEVQLTFIRFSHSSQLKYLSTNYRECQLKCPK
jgi:hypothetical protein